MPRRRGDTPTSSAPQEKTYITVSLYSDPDAKKYDVKVNFGQALAHSLRLAEQHCE